MHWGVKTMEERLFEKKLTFAGQEKSLEVICGDITKLSFPADILVCSAYAKKYAPVPGSLIGALHTEQGIDVEALSLQPAVNMLAQGIWLSQALEHPAIRRIACAEMKELHSNTEKEWISRQLELDTASLQECVQDREAFFARAERMLQYMEMLGNTQWNGEAFTRFFESMKENVKQKGDAELFLEMLRYLKKMYFQEQNDGMMRLDWRAGDVQKNFSFSYDSLFMMLRFAGMQGIPIHTVVMPLLGTGHQKLNAQMSLKSLIAGCKNTLRDVPEVQRIVIVDISREKAEQIARGMQAEYDQATEKSVFISYSHMDYLYAQMLADRLEKMGVTVWIDREQIIADGFAGIIVRAIRSADLFTVLISRDSVLSRNVLAEVQNAFNTPRGSKAPLILPIRLDRAEYTDDFSYYLTGMHYEEANEPPIEGKLQQIAGRIEGMMRNGKTM